MRNEEYQSPPCLSKASKEALLSGVAPAGATAPAEHAPTSNLRILYLSQSRLPSNSANSVHVMHMCQALAELGHTVTLCGYQGSADNCYEYYHCSPSFALVRFKVAEKTGESLKLALKVALWLTRQREFDLIYSRSAVCLAAGLLLGKPFIYEIHSAPRTAVHRWLERWILRSKWLRKTVFISRALQDHYRSNFNLPAKAHSMVLADAANPFKPALTELELPGSSPHKVGYLGHLYPGKGGETILKIAARMPEVDFHLIGGRPQDIARLQDSGATANVYFHGHVAHARTGLFLQSIDIFLAPYAARVTLAHTDADVGQWMSPLKLFEYMAAGKVIICSDLPVLREVMNDGKNCLLAEPGSINSWCEHINRVLQDPLQGERLTTAALGDFQRHFTWQQRARKVCNAI